MSTQITPDPADRTETNEESPTGRPGPTFVQLGRGTDILAQSAWRLYFETSQKIRMALEARLKEHTRVHKHGPLGHSDYNTMLLLWEAPDHTLTMSALAKKLVFSPSRLNYRIKVLEDAGLVRKEGCPGDRRAHNIRLTELGARTFLDIGGLHRQDIAEIFLNHVDAAELEVLQRVFARIDKALPD